MNASDSTHFDALVSPHIDCMLARARSVLGCDDLAWDAVQQTLVQVWRNGRIPEQPRGVLLRLVRPVSLQLLRTRGRRHNHESAAASHRHGGHDEGSQCFDPFCLLEQKELEERLLAMIDELPESCREAFRLRTVEELEYTEISTRLGLPVGTVRSRLHRARSLFQSAWEREGARRARSAG